VKKKLCLLLLCMLLMSALPAQADHYRNWYEVFVYSYKDSNGDGIGDLKGLIEKLPYIEGMGYNGLWLMPVMASPSYHKYDVTDYFSIDPQYGTMEDMRQLVNDCHRRDIKIIIDLPINHTSTRHPWFLDAVYSIQKRTYDSPYLEYYCFTQQPEANHVQVNGAKWYYEEQFAGGNMPDLNLNSEKLYAEIEKILAFWLEDVGVDGFRLDAVTSFYAKNTTKNVEFLNKLKATCEKIKPGSFLVGEAWAGIGTIAEYYQSDIDSFFLFPASQAEGYIARATRGRSPAKSYVQDLTNLYETLPGKLLAPFIGNHDTGRAVGSLQGRSVPARAKFGETLMNLIGGAAFTYYGEEIGMVGSGDDPNKRLAMYWAEGDMTQQPPGVTQIEYHFPSVEEQLKDEHSILNYCKALNHLKLKVPSIARGETEFVYSDSNLCVMKKVWEKETCYAVLNFSASKTCEYTLSAPALTLAGILDASEEKASCTLDENGAQIILPPFAAVFFTVSK